jgi:hypothetical protein
MFRGLKHEWCWRYCREVEMGLANSTLNAISAAILAFVIAGSPVVAQEGSVALAVKGALLDGFVPLKP